MTRLEDVTPPDGHLVTERVSEAHHVRTFSGDELLQILLNAVKREAGHDDAAIVGSSVKLVSPTVLERVTVRVAVREASRK